MTDHKDCKWCNGTGQVTLNTGCLCGEHEPRKDETFECSGPVLTEEILNKAFKNIYEASTIYPKNDDRQP